MGITELVAQMDRKFRIGCEPFILDKSTYLQIDNLGTILLQFYQAVNELYFI